MSTLFSGLIHVTGEHDTGKTMFAFSSGAMPIDTAFIDDDIKGVDVVTQFKAQGHDLGFYVNLVTECEKLKELGFHNKGLEIIEKMKDAVKERGKIFEVLIWDTWSRFETTFHPYVHANPQQFRSNWSPKGDIKGAEEWKASFDYESTIINNLLSVAKLVILTTHLKPDNIAGRKTGKFIPDCKQPLFQKSALRVYLRHNPDGPAPIGLILKRISKQLVTNDGVKIISVLPRKMKPFTWDHIRYYWDNPIGDRPLTEDEKPDEWELSILDGTLTEDQKNILKLHDIPMLNSDDEEEQGMIMNPGVVEKVFELKDAGKPNPIIAKELDITIKEVAAILRTR